MYFLYSIILSIGFLLMLPLFLLRREKYASGSSERLGNYPEFKHDGRKVIWLHCVSVGETNAARPLVEKVHDEFPDHRLIISTTTKTGQELARNIFADKADAIFYFPFDWKFSVRRALAIYKPSLVLLMETEIWPRFIREAKLSGAKIAIVNGRSSQKSFDRYSKVGSFIRTVLNEVDLALMQSEADAARILGFGIDPQKVKVTGNMKFEQVPGEANPDLTEEFRRRFGISADKPLIIAASTHDPEERYVMEALEDQLSYSCRLMIAPRHPERFDAVEKLLRNSPYSFVRRSSPESGADANADIILLDTIGELRAAYPLAEIAFVGGSLIPHGGQSIIEPAAEGKAIVVGPYTANFDAVVREFLENSAVRQTSTAPDDFQVSERLYEQFTELLQNDDTRRQLGRNAAAVMARSKRDSTEWTIHHLGQFLRNN
ncbi:MAG: 3-deoxy-D-manno-octulosonic acid transferase [Pyrinomonadaceae bacterium]